MEEEFGTALAPRELYTNNHVDPPVSHFMVGLLFVLGFVVLGIALVHRWRELALATEAEGALDPASPLRPGGHFVKGTVELARGESTAVKVEIEQEGTENKVKNGWVHSWQEQSRTITARPFYLRRDDGERVRVHPRTDVLLVDELDQMFHATRSTRFCTAELTAGEVAVVEGVLRRGEDPEASAGERGYRDAARGGWVMSSPLGIPLHISTEELAERHRLRARRFGKSALLATGMLLLGALPTMPYLFCAVAAEPTTAVVEGRRYYETRGSRGGRVQHHVVDLDMQRPEGGTQYMVAELDQDDWSTVQRGHVLRYRYFDDENLVSSPGAGSSIHYALLLLALACMLGAGWSVYSAARWKRWYEGPLRNAGKGRLPEPS
ncbi:MAG: hypothetical protein AB8I08_27765 [Sandaracinaceae bacterium]